ncbi:MAG: hypothetical protein PUP46_07880 [Endozoicomonas sp. (ex Botrylloides leachii)]|nr:hypothetical protein [Endozoicomonas sp. (ex Botrylloides leachii)]
MTWYFDTVKLTQAIPYIDFPVDNQPATIATMTDDTHPYLTDPTWLAPDGTNTLGYDVGWSGTDVIRVAVPPPVYTPDELRGLATTGIKDSLVNFVQSFIGNTNAKTSAENVLTYISELTDYIALSDEQIVNAELPTLDIVDPVLTISAGQTLRVHCAAPNITSGRVSLDIINGDAIYHTCVRLYKLSVSSDDWMFDQSALSGVKPAIELSVTNGNLLVTNNEATDIQVTTYIG